MNTDAEGLFEGDMKLTDEQRRFIEELNAGDTGNEPRKAVANLNLRWNGAVVPYVIDSSSGMCTALKKDYFTLT